MPPSSKSHKKIQERISHDLNSRISFADDLELLNRQDIIDNPDMKWIVFKVKQRAKANYYDNIYSNGGGWKGSNKDQYVLDAYDDPTDPNPTEEAVRAIEQGKTITYNWPYDFFSVIELLKIKNEVSMAGTSVISTVPGPVDNLGMPLSRNARQRLIRGGMAGGGIAGVESSVNTNYVRGIIDATSGPGRNRPLEYDEEEDD
jgi:hypothetical protein